MTTTAPQTFDRQAAEAYLAELRRDLASIERKRGKFPEPVAKSIADGLAIAQGYIDRAEAEIVRGCTPMDLLRAARRSLLRTATRSWNEAQA